MEIIEYLRVAKRRWWILVLVPVLAAGLTTAFLLLQPTTYSATATINSGALVGNEGSPFSGTQAAQSFVAAFSAAADNPSVKAQVAQATGVSASDQTDGVTSTAVGTSSDVQVAYTDTKGQRAQEVVGQTARKALDLMFSSRAAAATATRDRALQANQDANAAISALATKYKIADPPRAYQTALSQVATLQQQQAQLRASGNAAGAAAMDAPIASAQNSLAQYLPILAEYNNLAATAAATQQDLATAQAQYRQALSIQSAAQGDAVIYVGPAIAASRVTTLVTTVVPVFAAGIFLGIILVVLVEVVSRLRRAAREEREAQAAGEPVPGSRSARRHGVDDGGVGTTGTAGTAAAPDAPVRAGDDDEALTRSSAASYR